MSVPVLSLHASFAPSWSNEYSDGIKSESKVNKAGCNWVTLGNSAVSFITQCKQHDGNGNGSGDISTEWKSI